MLPCQASVNRVLASHLGSKIRGTLGSFCGGVFALFLATLVWMTIVHPELSLHFSL